MRRSRAWRRHHTTRVIARRVYVIRQRWTSPYRRPGWTHPWIQEPHRLAKRNLNCGCVGCRIRFDKHAARREGADEIMAGCAA